MQVITLGGSSPDMMLYMIFLSIVFTYSGPKSMSLVEAKKVPFKWLSEMLRITGHVRDGPRI